MKCVVLLAAIVAMAAYVHAQNSFGTTYGDTGNDAPYLQSLSPPQGPKQGGTKITVYGTGFVRDTRAKCRFTRLNPNLETTVTKTTTATYVSNTEVQCDSPAWEEDACPTCGAANALSGTFSGHTGSKYLRATGLSTSTATRQITGTEIGVGDYIKLSAATVGATSPATYLTQYYQIAKITACGAVAGCVCSGGTWAESAYTVAKTFNATAGANVNSGHEQITATNTNNAMYVYDKYSETPGDFTMAGHKIPNPTCTGGTWVAGSKIELAEPVYKIDGKANVAFSGKIGHRASKFSCTSCKCQEGCKVTVSVTNDGAVFSGNGIGGFTWTGSALAFSLKDIVPTVTHIDHVGLSGYRDSTRIIGPASGGTTLNVYGNNFQQSNLLRCYFAGVRTLVKAEWVSDSKIQCKTPPFFSRQLDGSTTQSNQDGSAKNPHTKVHVTNDGMLGDPVGENDAFGHLSQNPHLNDDGSKSYIRTSNVGNTYINGAGSDNPFRSTCQEGIYPNEGHKPCYGAHTAGSAGNDVLFKYSTCYDAQAAGSALDLYSGTDTGMKKINQTSSLGLEFTLPQMWGLGGPGASAYSAAAPGVGGPLSHIRLHLVKPTSTEARIEVAISSAAFSTNGGTIISKETILVSSITDSTNYEYDVFFNTPAYLLPGTKYYLTLKWVSGAEDASWKYTNAANGGFYAHINTPLGYRFKAKFYTCDGCRVKYGFNPSSVLETKTFGDNSQTQEAGGSTWLASGTYRSMQAQEFRPSETGTITHAYLKLKNTVATATNGGKTAKVSIWITKHAKYGEYVCRVFGGLQTASKCDANMDGTFAEACALGTVCNPSLALNGGCGDRGTCGLAETVNNAHRLRPQSGGAAGYCGYSETCSNTMTLQPDHEKTITNVDGWQEFEFKTPVPIDKHTTYFLNAAVVGNPDVSNRVIWYSGNGNAAGKSTYTASFNNAGASANFNHLRNSYTRSHTTHAWEKNADCGGGMCVLATRFTRCVTSTPNVMSFSTSGEKTGCCKARASPQGGDKGATVTLTGRNFFPSDHLRCIFRNEDGTGGVTVPGTVTKSDYSEMTCKAPTHNPHSARDCTNPALCKGVDLVVTTDGYTVGPQYMGPKWKDPTGTSAIPAYAGQNPHKFLFTEIHVSPTGSDSVGDGTIGRPYQTIQRGVDASNQYDQLVLHPGVYTGLGNRGLRHHGKRIQLQAYKANRQNTIIDCQHAPDGLFLNNNKDSDSPHAGHIDSQDIITRNCENLRIYDI